MFPVLIVILISLFSVVYGANFFVHGSASISRRLGISAFIVGLTIISIGTSAPELFINVIAALRGAAGLSIGNVLGSNIADILLGLGIAAVIIPLRIKRGTVWKEIPYSLLGVLVVLFAGINLYNNRIEADVISRTEGLILLVFFAAFIVYTYFLAKKGEKDEKDVEVYGWAKSIAYTLGGVFILLLGGDLVVTHSVHLAQMLGISQNLIGITIVAAGTSLPEITTTIVAAHKGHIDLAVGGIVGTIIFNILLILGVTALVRPLHFSYANVTDALFLSMVTIMLFVFMFLGKKHKLDRWEGALMVAVYIGYMVFAIMRG